MSTGEPADINFNALIVQQLFRISNDWYGNSFLSAQKLVKGYTRHLSRSCPVSLPDELRTAYEKLIANRKLVKIMKSNLSRRELYPTVIWSKSISNVVTRKEVLRKKSSCNSL